jgi:nitrite reductase/ring-hydroxylating ferredoxin subunit
MSIPESRTVICEVPLERLRPTGVYRHQEGGVEALVLETPSGIRAYSGVCPHLGGPLLEARIEDGCVRCPWHDYRFDAATGRCLRRQGLELQPLDFSIEGGVLRIYGK